MQGFIAKLEDNNKSAYISFESPISLKCGDQVTVSKTKKVRSLQQNGLLWAFYEWVISPEGGDLQSQGHFSKDALHANVKEWIKVNHPMDFKVINKFSTQELTTQEFTLFFDLIKQDLFIEILGVDISGFEKELEGYQEYKEVPF